MADLRHSDPTVSDDVRQVRYRLSHLYVNYMRQFYRTIAKSDSHSDELLYERLSRSARHEPLIRPLT